MPSFPEIIATRGFLYKFLADLGWDKSEQGFRSLDYTVFTQPSFGVPLTCETERDELLGRVQEGTAVTNLRNQMRHNRISLR